MRRAIHQQGLAEGRRANGTAVYVPLTIKTDKGDHVAIYPTTACRRYGCWPNRTTGCCNRCGREV